MRTTFGDCRVLGCIRLAQYKSNRLCHMHYSRLQRYGDVNCLKRATSTPGMSPAAKKIWVDNYKITIGCADCGYKDHPAALDFDHLPGSIKIRDIKSGQQLGWVALQEEVAKCEVVCANCHRIRTYERLRELDGTG